MIHNHHDQDPQPRRHIDALDLVLTSYIVAAPATAGVFILSEVNQWWTPEIRIAGVLGAEAVEFGLFLAGAFLATRARRRRGIGM